MSVFVGHHYKELTYLLTYLSGTGRSSSVEASDSGNFTCRASNVFLQRGIARTTRLVVYCKSLTVLGRIAARVLDVSYDGLDRLWSAAGPIKLGVLMWQFYCRRVEEWTIPFTTYCTAKNPSLLMVETRDRSPCSTPKFPLPVGDLDLHLTDGYLGPHESTPQTVSRSAIFAHLTSVTNTHTHTHIHTDDVTCLHCYSSVRK